MTALLELKSLSKKFGGVLAVNQLSLEVNEGEIVGLIGPNGAGKSTVFEMISGFLSPTQGEILLRDRHIQGLQPHAIAQAGVGRVFQHSVLFGRLSVIDNVKVSLQRERKGCLLSAVVHTKRSREQERVLADRARQLLDFVGLLPCADQEARALPHGLQRCLSIAIALAGRPSIVLLDEPVTGMNPTESAETASLIKRVRDDLGITVLLVEHDMKVVTGICERVVVINFGAKLCEGSAEYVTSHPDVCAAYLGSGAFDVA